MDEKKKTIVVACLFVVVIGVGAFQFMGGGLSGPQEKQKGKDASKSAVASKDKKSNESGKFEIRNPLYVKALPTRDPFEEGLITNVKPDPNDKTKPAARRGPSDRGPIIPPVDPRNIGPGPIPDGWKGPIPGGQIKPPDAFTMSVTGVIMGTRPAAVFQDDQGNQRLIGLGGEVDEGTRVTGISRGRVTVSHKGKTVTLTVGANTNGK